MRRVVVDMQNYLFADAVAQTLKNADSDFDVHGAETPGKTVELCRLYEPYALLMEVTGYTPWKIEERMKLRGQIRQKDPDCKIAFLVDEKSEPAVAQKVRRAKADGLIDQFIYTSISASYLLGVMETI